MDFTTKINNLSKTIDERKDKVFNEESTKNSLILPFIQALGFDVFDPDEVLPEYTTDIGTKRGEKVDYAIMYNGSPVTIIECKPYRDKLASHNSQIVRYFNVSPAKFAIITNGVDYEFYTDVDNKNIMDQTPFMSFDITKITPLQIEELKNFTKNLIENIDSFYENISIVKHQREVKILLHKELTSEPSDEFVRHFASGVGVKRVTSNVLETFAKIVKKSRTEIIGELVNDRLNEALNKEKQRTEEELLENEEETTKFKRGIETTEDELQAYYVVRSIVSDESDMNRITKRDVKSYFNVLYDDNNRKPICRFYFNNPNNMQIGIFGTDKEETKFHIDKIDDIYKYKKQLIDIVVYYEETFN